MMDEALIEVRDKLSSSMGSAGTTFYAGDVGLPFKNSLPAIIVRERYTEIERASTAKDKYRFGLSILVVTDMVKSFNESGISNRIVGARQTLRKLVEEADTDGAPKTTTVLGALMKTSNVQGTNYVYNINSRVNYQPESPDGFFYVAAEITLELLTDFITRKA